MESEKDKIKYFLYARRSVEKKDNEERVLSIDSQLQEMKEIIEREGLNVVKTFSETKSAKYPGRPIFNDMIQQIQNGKANGIICWKMDRLSRNPVDEGTIKYLLREGIVKHIRASDRSWYPDDNALIASVEFGVADQFLRDLSKHVKRGLHAKADRGMYPSTAPLGYKNSKYRLKGQEEILVDEERFDLIRKMFDLMLTGQYSAAKILRIADNEWRLRTRTDRKLAKSCIYKIFTNPFYYGMFEYPKGNGKWYKGTHKPMITAEEFDAIQFLLGRKGKPRPKHHIFAYTGFMKCGECGASITAEEKYKYQKNGNVHHYIYYRCTKRLNANCMQRSVEEKVLDKEINSFLSQIEISSEFHEWAIEELKIAHEKEMKDRNNILYKQQKEYNQCVNDLDELLKMRMRKEITVDLFSRQLAVLEKDKIKLKCLLDNVNKRIDSWLKAAENTLTFAEKARFEFAKGNTERKREILGALGLDHILKDRILHIQTKKPLLVIKEMAFEAQRVDQMLEPVKNVSTEAKFNDFYSKSTLLCAQRELNPRPSA